MEFLTNSKLPVGSMVAEFTMISRDAWHNLHFIWEVEKPVGTRRDLYLPHSTAHSGMCWVKAPRLRSISAARKYGSWQTIWRWRGMIDLLNSIAAMGILHSKITSTNMYRLFCNSWFSVSILFAMNQSQQTKQLRQRMLDTVLIYCIFINGWAGALGSRWISSAGNQSGFWCHCSKDLFLPVSMDVTPSQ